MARFRRGYLHIGFEKTGSTSIQRFLTDNIERLGQHGHFVPASVARTDGFCNHLRICAYALDSGKSGERGDDTLLHYGVEHEADLPAFREETVARLADEAARCGDQRFMILSNEHLSSRIDNLAELSRLKDLLYRFCDNVRVIAYLRRQSDVLESAYNEAVKTGFHDIDLVPDFSPDAKRQWVGRRYFDYYPKLERWAEMFGERNVLVKLFDRQAMLFGDVVQDFLFSIHLDPSKFGSFPRVNEGLARPAQLFLQNINKPLSALPPQKSARIRELLTDILTKKVQGRGRRLTSSEVADFQSQFADDNEQIRRRWFPTRPVLFAVPTPDDQERAGDAASDQLDRNEAFEMMSLVLREIVI